MTTRAQVITIDPDPLAPYAIAPGWRVGDLLFLSGQAAIEEHGAIVGAATSPPPTPPTPSSKCARWRCPS